MGRRRRSSLNGIGNYSNPRKTKGRLFLLLVLTLVGLGVGISNLIQNWGEWKNGGFTTGIIFTVFGAINAVLLIVDGGGAMGCSSGCNTLPPAIPTAAAMATIPTPTPPQQQAMYPAGLYPQAPQQYQQQPQAYPQPPAPYSQPWEPAANVAMGTPVMPTAPPAANKWKLSNAIMYTPNIIK
uniref:Uncharacterized protein n=1 Tax=Chloropicon laureae TaxID=464258 RepID=A0A7S3E647_9CHLO|mmetsp:Transcript_8854/g.22677  ORF Transcript_8854/g.22677 Transcript_8854/m.22677 type:complete len:182 (+) Transcript_8854:82-627(+)